jgi:hypothetical protein
MSSVSFLAMGMKAFELTAPDLLHPMLGKAQEAGLVKPVKDSILQQDIPVITTGTYKPVSSHRGDQIDHLY